MIGTIKIAWAVVRFVWDWAALAYRVRKMLTNDFPHLDAKVDKMGRKLDGQIAYCHGVRDAGGCEAGHDSRDPSDP